jgi:hypothetical protein
MFISLISNLLTLFGVIPLFSVFITDEFYRQDTWKWLTTCQNWKDEDWKTFIIIIVPSDPEDTASVFEFRIYEIFTRTFRYKDMNHLQ